ncbi:universal stress protein [Aureisphaera galaxeae]|uniref:universal stress protein n=1 Tax=Aureisphaera galaxeae TaxID=1538023 RepID=UPI00234FD75C|nr:universal stress protein [Aureisphaera galaxeae]MDC8003774.1 universal stress protein [Aureisphaera galaxeae]
MINVLVPTDFSENAWNAIRYGIQFFAEEPANFYLLHIDLFNREHKDTVANGIFLAPTSAITSGDRLASTLERIHETFPKTRHHFHTLLRHSFFIEGIKQEVTDKGIDFILMGTKGASGLKEVTVGSRTGEVIARVKCPILIVPERAEFAGLKDIALPTDFHSYYKNKILLTLAEILEQHQPTLHILHLTDEEKALSDEQLEHMNFLMDFLEGRPHQFHFRPNGPIEDGLANFVEDSNVQLIAMVAKNINFFQRLLFRSSAEKISYHTKIPFLVLHE